MRAIKIFFLLLTVTLTSCEKEIATDNMLGNWKIITVVEDAVELDIEGYMINFLNGTFEVRKGYNGSSIETARWIWDENRSNTFNYWKYSDPYSRIHECTVNSIKSNKMELTFIENELADKQKKYRVTCKKSR